MRVEWELPEEALLGNPRSFFVALGLKLSEVSWVYMLTVFVVVYATTKLGLPRTLMLDSVFWAALVEVISIPLFGYFSDRIGRRPFYFLGVVFTVVFAFPLVFDLLFGGALEAAEACANSSAGRMQGRTSARTQPALIHPCSCAR